jgi:acetyltransferase-like isoleucine patch superfamily enzyme
MTRTWEDPLKLLPRILTKLNGIWVALIYPFHTKGRKLSVHYTCDIRNPQLIAAGNDIIIHKDVWLHAWPSESDRSSPHLRIGDNCLIGRRSHISARNLIDLGSDVIVSASVLIQDHGHAFQSVDIPIRLQGLAGGGTIVIGRGSWIGQGAAIICSEGELVLGENCVVAANAVVTKSAPPYSVLSGNPARIVKQWDRNKGAWVLGSSRAVDLAAVETKA